ncbi:MAG: nitrate reductase cytochrome c-type subunit [Campylobacterota bacterium]
MKAMGKLTIALAAAALLMVGCGETDTAKATPVKEVKPAPTVTEESLGLRKTDLYSEDTTTGDETKYGTDAAGTSQKIERAFQDAPPMIPHDVANFLPITVSSNQCTGCHMPEVAEAMGATPIPASHFLDMRPQHKFDGKQFTKTADVMKNETSVKKIDALSGSRFNCSLCHAPQSTGALVVENTFEATFNKKDGASLSSWDEVVLDGLDTVGHGAAAVTADDLDLSKSAAGSLDGGH